MHHFRKTAKTKFNLKCFTIRYNASQQFDDVFKKCFNIKNVPRYSNIMALC